MSPNEKGIRVVSGSEDNTVNVVNDDLESEKQNSLLLIYELLFLLIRNVSSKRPQNFVQVRLT